MKEIQKCSVVVYDITLDKNQILEAQVALQGKKTINKILVNLYLMIGGQK